MVELSYAGQEVKVTRTVLETADAPTTFILLKKAELIDGELVDYAGSEWHVWAEDAAGEIAYDATATTGRGRQLRPRAHPPRRRARLLLPGNQDRR